MDYSTTSFRAIKRGLGLQIQADKTEEKSTPQIANETDADHQVLIRTKKEKHIPNDNFKC